MNTSPPAADLARLVDHARKNVDYMAQIGAEYTYAHLPLCVIDAVFSIGVRYESVRAVVARYAAWAGLEQFRSGNPVGYQRQTIRAFCDRVNDLGVDGFVDVAKNRCRTSSRNGILKADAVIRFACVLRDTGVDDFSDVAAAVSNDLLDHELRAIPGQRSGISVRYFFMLAGDDQTVKPDRMLIRFCEAAVGRDVTSAEAAGLVTAAARALSSDSESVVTPRALDHAIWSWQRTRQV